MQTLQLEQENLQEVIIKASKIIKDGGLVIAPFDTVYGFICDPFNNEAVAKLNAIKGRPETKTIGLAASSLEKISQIVDLSEQTSEFIKNKTPGKFTFILPDNGRNEISKLCQRGETVAVRIPDTQLILNIAEKCGGFLAQTSANKSGRANCYSLDDVKDQFNSNELEKIDLIIDGRALEASAPSELWDLTGEEPRKIERS